MADLSDVTAFLKALAVTAVYPNGSSQASVAAMDCRIYEGWPIPDQLDLDMAGKMLNSASPPVVVARPNGPVANVSVFPLAGQGAPTYQTQDNTYVISQPTYGMTPTLNTTTNTLTVTGEPNTGEYITVELDRQHVYSRNGATTAAILSALLTDIQVLYPTATGSATTLVVPSAFKMVVRQGGKGRMGKVVHRQIHEIAVTTWAPNHTVRATIASAIDLLIKENLRVTLSDSSQAVIRYSRTNTSDEQQSQTIYRRDLIYAVEYATVQQFDAYVITSVNTSIANAAGSATATAIT